MAVVQIGIMGVTVRHPQMPVRVGVGNRITHRGLPCIMRMLMMRIVHM